MKIVKQLLLTGIFALLITGCKSTSATTTKLDRTSQSNIKGNWTITSVSYPGSNVIAVNSFGIADSQCFVGSNWKFVSNNNKGTMALTKSGCPAFSSDITWFINKDGQFVLKVLYAGEKARKVREGYVVNVANQTENSFQLVDRIDVGGKMTDVVYQFQKN